MIGLFNYPTTGGHEQHFVIVHSPINDFTVKCTKYELYSSHAWIRLAFEKNTFKT